MMRDRITKQAALNLLSRGQASYAEVAALSGESRQTVRYWAKDLPPGLREAHLAKLWKQAQAWAAENEPAMKMVRREMARAAREG